MWGVELDIQIIRVKNLSYQYQWRNVFKSFRFGIKRNWEVVYISLLKFLQCFVSFTCITLNSGTHKNNYSLLNSSKALLNLFRTSLFIALTLLKSTFRNSRKGFIYIWKHSNATNSCKFTRLFLQDSHCLKDRTISIKNTPQRHLLPYGAAYYLFVFL